MIYKLNILSGSLIESFSYRNSINNLPNANVRVLNIGNDLILRLWLREINTEFIKVTPKASFDIISRNWNKIWSLDLVYSNFMKYPPKQKTQTQCKLSLLGVMNYILSFYPQFSSYINNHNIPNIGKIYRYDFNDIGIIGYLQYLEEFGYYWFIDMENSNLVLNRYDNVIYKESNHLVSKYSNIMIRDIFPEYKNIYLIKEPYSDNLEREIVLDASNPCVVLNNPARNYTIISSTPGTYLLAFTVNGDKIGGQFNEFSSALQNTSCVSQSITDCQNKYTFTFRGTTLCNAPCNTAVICSRTENETGNTVDCNGNIYISPGVDCIGQLKMVLPCNLTFTNQKIVVRLSDFCDVDLNCILDGVDYDFDKKQLTTLISSNLNLPDVNPASISFSNIDSVIWNLIIQYYQLKTKVKRIYTLSNPVCNGKLEVGYFYDVLINNIIRSNLLLEELEIQGNENSFNITATFSEYI